MGHPQDAVLSKWHTVEMRYGLKGIAVEKFKTLNMPLVKLRDTLKYDYHYKQPMAQYFC